MVLRAAMYWSGLWTFSVTRFSLWANASRQRDALPPLRVWRTVLTWDPHSRSTSNGGAVALVEESRTARCGCAAKTTAKFHQRKSSVFSDAYWRKTRTVIDYLK